MAKVPVPDRGQPLDVTYIYTLANAINEVSDSVADATYNYTSVDLRNIGRQDIKNNNAKFYATYIDIVNNETVTANTTRNFTINFATNFKYPPIVVASAVNTGSSDIGNDIFAVITSVTTSQVNGIVRFNTAGNSVSAAVNIIAIGLPG
jgi:hypothetical protein